MTLLLRLRGDIFAAVQHTKFHTRLLQYLQEELPESLQIRTDPVTGELVDLGVSNISQELVVRNWSLQERFAILNGFLGKYNQGEYLPNFLQEWNYAMRNGLIK